MTEKIKTKLLKNRMPFRRKEQREEKAKRKKVHPLPLGEWFRSLRLGWLALPALSLIIAIFLFPNILSKPQVFNLGDVAERDIKASHDFLIEDKEQTEKNREKAAREVLPVYDFDTSDSNLVSRLKDAFNIGREYYAKLLVIEDPEQVVATAGEKMSQDILEEDNLTKSSFFAALEISPDNNIFEYLKKVGFSAEVKDTTIRLATQVFKRGIVGNRTMLMDHIEKGGIILHEISTQKEIGVNNFDRFFDLEGARRFIESQRDPLKKAMSHPGMADVSIRLAQSLIKPNLTFNQRETELRKELARKPIKPTYFKIKKGEMLVREGERIGHEHLLRLSEGTRAKDRVNVLGRLPAMAILIGLLFSVIYQVVLKGIKSFKGDRRDILFNSITLLGLFIFAWVCNFIADEIARGFHFFSSRALLFAIPIACGGMLLSVFQGLTLAVSFSLVISVLVSLITGGRIEFFLYFFISSLVAAYGVTNCTERGILIKTGLKVGLVNTLLCLSIEMIYGSFYSVEAIIAAISGFIGGLLAGVIATGILPLIEMSFGFTTDIKLLELANFDQPLLREFMVQCPGTYHHSVIISNMVEATAKAVDANPLLSRVSAYYHDIGKLKKPLYFIENQLEGENKHEKLAPSMSSLILMSHVKDGVELAREHKLGKEIADIIQQHHGTSIISFFYQKAKEQMVKKGDKSILIKEENFQYPGPKPQTKEAGLVMLADVVEAAARSLKDPTPSRIQGMVQKIINKVFSDGQLDECELTLKDLHEIAKSFNKTLSGIFHHRIEYPEIVAKNGKNSRNGSTDQVSEEDSRAKKQEDKAEIENGLKRLGL
ncbi:MAG: HDIG domain-containing protein [Thermodesulfobacteriota bacterium]|nr:HDIG domain-containing protein [Thermodesulfobacteriota bacterium]